MTCSRWKNGFKAIPGFWGGTWDESWSLCNPAPVFPGSDLNSCCSLSLSLRSVKHISNRPDWLSLSPHLYTLCLHWRLSFRSWPAQRWFNLGNMDWLWFYSVACWSFKAHFSGSCLCSASFMFPSATFGSNSFRMCSHCWTDPCARSEGF